MSDERLHQRMLPYSAERALAETDNPKLDKLVVQITDAWNRTVRTILETGRLLIEAKARVKHGEWEAFVAKRLPFHIRTAEKLIRIAEHPILSNPTHESLLPRSYVTLYELATMRESDLQEAFEQNEIFPEMTRSDASRLSVIRLSQMPRALEILEYCASNFTPEEIVSQYGNMIVPPSGFYMEYQYLRSMTYFLRDLANARMEYAGDLAPGQRNAPDDLAGDLFGEEGGS